MVQLNWICVVSVFAACAFVQCSGQDGQADELFTAVRQNDAAAIKRLVSAGASPNSKDRDGNTPLHLAIDGGDANTVKALMDSEADPTLRNKNGFSSFFLAAVVKEDMALTAIVMKVADNSSDAVPYLPVDFGSTRQAPQPFIDTASLVQLNPRFGYRFIASPDWKLCGIQQDGLIKRQSIVVFSLAPTPSELEKQDIENAISLVAFDDPALRNLDEVLAAFIKRTPEAAKAEVTENKEVDRITLDYELKKGSLTYKLRTVLLHRNGLAYQIDFTATPGTFDKNLPVFLAFCESVQFRKPDTSEPRPADQRVK